MVKETKLIIALLLLLLIGLVVQIRWFKKAVSGLEIYSKVMVVYTELRREEMHLKRVTMAVDLMRAEEMYLKELYKNGNGTDVNGLGSKENKGNGN